MPAPLLSVCMPTYNYGRFISQAIASVEAQRDEAVELVVLDGGSTDDTETIVRQWTARWPAVRYVRQAERGGIDADLARSVELARGEYCWLLSADDALEPGALVRIRGAFAAGAVLVLCNRLWCDRDLQPIAAHAWLERIDDAVFDFSRRQDLERYLGAARSLGALFSFMSCIGFRRAAWTATEPPAPVPCYTHVGRLFTMAQRGGLLACLGEALVRCRSGADSFSAGGLASRLLIDLRGYRQLAQALFPGEEALREAFLGVVLREHPPRRWIRARGEVRDATRWRELAEELARFGVGPARLAYIGAAGRLLRLLR